MPSRPKDGTKVRHSEVSDLHIEANEEADRRTVEATQLVQHASPIVNRYIMHICVEGTEQLALLLLWIRRGSHTLRKSVNKRQP